LLPLALTVTGELIDTWGPPTPEKAGGDGSADDSAASEAKGVTGELSAPSKARLLLTAPKTSVTRSVRSKRQSEPENFRLRYFPPSTYGTPIEARRTPWDFGRFARRQFRV
jgi:hypothetical protein